MISMYIGSGDVAALMSGKATKGHQSLLRRFVSGEKPYYNAFASPIDACRIGAILEGRYLLTLPDSYYPQYVVESKEMNVFKCSLDFARLESGEVIDFDELKSISFNDFMLLEQLKREGGDIIAYVKSNYKHYYQQVQEQLYCTELDSANLVFLPVYSYIDEENYNRNILENEIFKIRIRYDSEFIESMKIRGSIFQQIKDYYET